MELRPELLDKLQQLGLEAYEMIDVETGGGIFAMKGPTWCVNPKTSIASFKEDFISDEHGSMRDYAAIPQYGLKPFFPDPDILLRKATHRDFSEFIHPETLAIHPSFKPQLGFNYFFGGDLSVSGDSTGISLVHYDYFVNKIFLDFNLRIKSTDNSRIDYGPIRQLIFALKERGFNIKEAAFDQFQSNDSINILSQGGIETNQKDYARTFVGNIQLQELIYNDKFVYYDDQVDFIGEAQHLIVVNSKRIDHPSSGQYANRKDCWDSAVNATLCAIDDYYKNGNLAQNNQKVIDIADKLLNKEKKDDNIDDLSWIL